MKYISVAIFLTILVMLLTSIQCKEKVATEDINSIVFPDSNVSYAKYVDPLFRIACAIPGGCHAGEDPAANLSLESWLDLNTKIYIVYIPKDPDNSVLVRAIEGTQPGVERMPLGRPPLNANQIKGIRTWIKEGAQNN